MWLVEQRLGLASLEDGTAVRFAVAGRGPVAIYVPGWVSHLELGWALPAEREFYEGLADGRTLVRYDRPGCGLSGTTDRTDVVELELEVLHAVATAVGADRFDLIGASFGAPLAVRWAARHPESVSHLVLYGGWVDGDGVAAPAVREHVLGLVDQHWGFASDVLTEIFAPDADAGFRAVFSRYQRESTSAAWAHQLLAACYDIDVADDLGRITAPTSVIHRKDDRAVPIAEGERLAAGIDGATLTVLAGRTHIPFAGDTHSVLNAMRRGLGLPSLDRGTPAHADPAPDTGGGAGRAGLVESADRRRAGHHRALRRVPRRTDPGPARTSDPVPRSQPGTSRRTRSPDRRSAVFPLLTTSRRDRHARCMTHSYHATRHSDDHAHPCASRSSTTHPARGRFNSAFFWVMGGYINWHMHTRKATAFADLPPTVVELGLGSRARTCATCRPTRA